MSQKSHYVYMKTGGRGEGGEREGRGRGEGGRGSAKGYCIAWLLVSSFLW